MSYDVVNLFMLVRQKTHLTLGQTFLLLVGNTKRVWKTIANGSFVKPLKTSISFVAWKLLHHKAKLHPLQMETFYIIIVKCLRLDNPRSLIKRRQKRIQMFSNHQKKYYLSTTTSVMTASLI